MMDRTLWTDISLSFCVAGIIIFSDPGSLLLFNLEDPMYAAAPLEIVEIHNYIFQYFCGAFWFLLWLRNFKWKGLYSA